MIVCTVLIVFSDLSLIYIFWDYVIKINKVLAEMIEQKMLTSGQTADIFTE